MVGKLSFENKYLSCSYGVDVKKKRKTRVGTEREILAWAKQGLVVGLVLCLLSKNVHVLLYEEKNALYEKHPFIYEKNYACI